MNKLFTVLGGKFKFSAQDSDLEYLVWQRKNSSVSSDLKPPLVCTLRELKWFQSAFASFLWAFPLGLFPSRRLVNDRFIMCFIAV